MPWRNDHVRRSQADHGADIEACGATVRVHRLLMAKRGAVALRVWGYAAATGTGAGKKSYIALGDRDLGTGSDLVPRTTHTFESPSIMASVCGGRVLPLWLRGSPNLWPAMIYPGKTRRGDLRTTGRRKTELGRWEVGGQRYQSLPGLHGVDTTHSAKLDLV